MKYIIPKFEKAQKLMDLVETLKRQHLAGRAVTAATLEHSQPNNFRKMQNRNALLGACASFIRMYRLHEAREDTALFPALRTILRGDRMEEDEHKVLWDEGFEKNVAQLEVIEKQLGIYKLAQFTPKV